MEGNAEEPAQNPPAGGFGAHAGPSGAQVRHTPHAPKSSGALHVFGIVGGALVLLVVVFELYMEHRKREAFKWAEGYNWAGELAKKVDASYAKNHELCPSAAPVPRDFEAVRGRRYTASRADWEADPGWSCLGFANDYPSRYQLHYERSGPNGEFFAVRAIGDLDANDIRSTYEIHGHVDPATHALVVDWAVKSSNEGE